MPSPQQLSASTPLYVVTHQVGGFAREDDPSTRVIGVYTDEALAKKLALLFQGKVEPVKDGVNKIPPGAFERADAFGVKLPGAVA